MEIYFNQEGREKLLRGIHTLSSTVKSTLGPSGKTVIIDSPNHTRGLTITKDGVTVAKSVTLPDPVENMAVRIVREASERTALMAGDGTTTSIVISEALVDGALSLRPDWGTVKRINELAKITEKKLDRMSVRTTRRMVEDIATISANNDRSIGKIIADTYKKVGRNGVVTLEKSYGSETYSDAIKGVRLDRGYTNKLFVNNHKTDEFIVENCYILMTDIELSGLNQLNELWQYIAPQKKPLLIVASCTPNFTNTLASNVVQGGQRFCIIEPPQFGYKQHEIMQDLAVATGGVFFSTLSGDDTSLISIDRLGKASKVVVSRDKTVIVPDTTHVDRDAINYLVNDLKEAEKNAQKKQDKDFIRERISYLTGGIGIIHVGGNSDIEQKELFDRVDDAVCAVQSAMEEGVLAGGGIALYRAGEEILKEVYNDPVAEYFAYAIQSPFRQIIENADIDVNEIIKKLSGTSGNTGLNVKTGEIGDMFEMGIVDPLKVTKTALKNAVSVATTILTTNAIVANETNR